MSILVLGPEQYRAINAAVERARARPTPWEVMKDIADDTPTSELMLADRAPGVEEVKRQYPSQHLMLGTYYAAICFEYQPAGLMKHLSVSSRAKDKVPGPEVMKMVCEAFGFSTELCKLIGSHRATLMSPSRPFRVWVEEYEPGRMAINVIEVEP